MSSNRIAADLDRRFQIARWWGCVAYAAHSLSCLGCWNITMGRIVRRRARSGGERGYLDTSQACARSGNRPCDWHRGIPICKWADIAQIAGIRTGRSKKADQKIRETRGVVTAKQPCENSEERRRRLRPSPSQTRYGGDNAGARITADQFCAPSYQAVSRHLSIMFSHHR